MCFLYLLEYDKGEVNGSIIESLLFVQIQTN